MAEAQKVVQTCTTLQKFWNKRNEKFKKMYRLIQMVDELAQDNMESFVGNDPRAAYNLLLGMLEQKIPHRIAPEELSLEQVQPAAELSRTFEVGWSDIFRQYRMRGRYYLRDLIGLLLATGWYSVFAIMSQDGSRFISEVWNPATVYPFWDNTLAECAHIFPVTEAQAKRMVARNSWQVPPPRSKMTVYDYWRLEGDNQVFNSIVLDNNLVKNDVREPRLKRIPIFISPVGGLPDTGDLESRGTSEQWKEEIGQAVVATNENIYRYWNKWWTFSMQLLRDTAQARTYEKAKSSKQIVKPEEWYRRGAHFRMAPDEDVGFITPPPIPVELRSSQLDMEAMMQRGGPSWAMFGNIQQQLTAYVMSQIAASASQISKPYHQGVVDCLTDIDNFFYDMIRENNYKPYGREMPVDLPEDTRLTAEYELRIPGDLVQRVTTARIMNPAFELSDEKIMEELFPEIKSPAEEIAKVRAGKARRHPAYAAIALIESFQEEARILRNAEDVDGAELYEKAADLVEASLTGAPEAEEVPPRGIRPPSVRPEVVPPPGAGPVVPKGYE